MNIKLFINEKTKVEGYYEAAAAEYIKRLKRYCKISVKKYKSREKLLREIQAMKCIICIDEDSGQLCSEELAERISEAEVKGISSAAVIVGEKAPMEFSTEIKRLSVSRMSLSCGLLSVVVLEQIYRAYKIINGEAYHK